MDWPTLRPKTQRGAPKHQTIKSVLSVRRHYPKKRSVHRKPLSSPAPNSPLRNPSNFGATASHWLLYFLLFSFFLIFNRMDAWSLMRGDAFIHFVCSSQRVNIRLGVLLLIPKSPQYIATRNSGATRRILREKWIFVRVSRLPLKLKKIFFFCVSSQPAFFFAKRLNWFLIVLFSRRIIYQILVSYLQIFNNFGNLLRVAGKLGLVGYDGFYFHFFFMCINSGSK